MKKITRSDKNIIVSITQNHKKSKINLSTLKNLAEHICKRFDVPKAVVNIVIVDDKGIKEINHKFLGHSNATDVISFNMSENCRTDCKKMFDIVVNLEKAAKEAKSRGHNKQAELALYITHGMLHNMGYNDLSKKQAQKMHKMEDKILKELGFGMVYNSEQILKL